MERTINYMESHLALPLTVARLAEQVGLSTSQLTRLFRASLNTTPNAYLRDLRMIRARLLVERTSLAVAEVMAHVGVEDPSHFAKDFRRAHGLSPRALRQELRWTGRFTTGLSRSVR